MPRLNPSSLPSSAAIDHADKAVQLQQRVLQRRGCKQHLRVDVRQCLFQRLGDDVAGLVDIAQAVSFVQNHQLPFDGLDVIGLGLGELLRADDGACCALERVAAVLLAKGVLALGLLRIVIHDDQKQKSPSV